MLGTLITLYLGLCIVTNSTHPILVVSSESMEPTFYRGDIIFLWNRQEIIRVGDIPVVWFSGKKEPMVHRAIKVEHHQSIRFGGSGNAMTLQQRQVCELLLI
jgi:signal peptidase